MEIKDFFLHKSPSNTWFRTEIHSLRFQLAISGWCQKKRWHHLPICDAYRYYV